MKPPPWTDDERGVELLAPPVCRRCEPWREGGGVEGRWGSVGTGDDDGDEEVGWAEAGGEEGSRHVVVDMASGDMRRITGERGGAGRERLEGSSVSGAVKRKRSGGAGPRAGGKKKRGEDDASDARWPAGKVLCEGRLYSEDSGRDLDADTTDTTVHEDPADPHPDDHLPASPPTPHDPSLTPSDASTPAHSDSADSPLQDREPLLPSAHAHQHPPRLSPPRPTTTPPQPTSPRPSPQPPPQPTPTPPTSLLARLSTLLTRHLLRRRPSVPTLPPHCAGCRLPLLSHTSANADPSTSANVNANANADPRADAHTSVSVRGPFNTRYHARCMRCTACERVLEGGTSWFELDEEGRVEVSCRRCWREGRIGRGWGVERVDFEEMGLGFVG